MADLSSLLDLGDLAVSRLEGILDAPTRRGLAATIARLRSRGGYVGDVVVVAIAGGTGSGKSSLLNALVAEPVAPVGIVRPTTAHATAVVPAGAEAGFGRLIADLGVDEVVRSHALTSTILVDLPDFDSVATAHRHIVGRVLPAVDAVLWVFDPEKYADRVVHDSFLARLAPYEDQFVFVLNQADRLGPDIDDVRDDLMAKLIADGYEDPLLVPCTASGAVEVSSVAAAIADRFDAKTTALAKAALDLRLAANTTWRRVPASETTGGGAHDRALARATLASLGVEAYDYWHTIERGRDTRHGN